MVRSVGMSNAPSSRSIPGPRLATNAPVEVTGADLPPDIGSAEIVGPGMRRPILMLRRTMSVAEAEEVTAQARGLPVTKLRAVLE